MESITITIPKKILSGRHGTRKLVVVDPKEFEKEIKRKWEENDTREAIRVARQEQKSGKLRVVKDLKELMK